LQFNLNNLEENLFDIIDQFKVIFNQELWDNILMNCTKNEMFVLLHLHRQSDVNMSSIAEYLDVPLNTATGIVSRMEKKNMVIRVRSKEDKRVVTIILTEQGKKQVKGSLEEVFRVANQILGDLTTEDLNVLNKLMTKTIHLLQQDYRDEPEENKPIIRKITIE
jgi:DNA-binding MarR family transcriptional regulator